MPPRPAGPHAEDGVLGDAEPLGVLGVADGLVGADQPDLGPGQPGPVVRLAVVGPQAEGVGPALVLPGRDGFEFVGAVVLRVTLDVIDSVAVRPPAEEGGRDQRVGVVPPAVEVNAGAARAVDVAAERDDTVRRPQPNPAAVADLDPTFGAGNRTPIIGPGLRRSVGSTSR